MNRRILVTIAVTTGLCLACQSSAPKESFEEVPPAEDLFARGQVELQGHLVLGVYRRIDYTKAIETFQAIIDNYPYSEYAVESELKIADAYFADKKYEEALSYYRDFSDLHPDNAAVPYSIYRAALCHQVQVEGKERDQTATRLGVHVQTGQLVAKALVLAADVAGSAGAARRERGTGGRLLSLA